MRGRTIASALVLLALFAGCRAPDEGGGESGELDIVDVGAPPDALVDPENDPVERRRARTTLAGVLPSDFPEELPPPEGASVVDLGERSVVFLVPESPAAVRSRFASRLRSRGWVEDGANAYRRNDVRVGVAFEGQGPSTRITVSY